MREFLPELSAAERRRELAGWLAREAARACRVPFASVSSDQPLTALGLDSLATIELQQAVESALGVAVPASALLEGATVAELADEILERLKDPAPAAPAVAAGSSAPAASFPLSHGQRALWFLDQLAHASAVYNLAAAARIAGELDAVALAGALADLVGRHPALATRFETRQGQPRQRGRPDVPADVH